MHSSLFSPFSTPSPRNANSDRKMKKPLMEKRRRKRINDSLSWLKDHLIVVAPQQRAKLEKADILEMTIEYIKMLQAGQAALPNTAESAFRRGLQEGFSGASKATFDFLNIALPPSCSTSQQMHHGLIRHLSASCTSMVGAAAGGSVPPSAPHLTPLSSPSSPSTDTDILIDVVSEEKASKTGSYPSPHSTSAKNETVAKPIWRPQF